MRHIANHCIMDVGKPVTSVEVVYIINGTAYSFTQDSQGPWMRIRNSSKRSWDLLHRFSNWNDFQICDHVPATRGEIETAFQWGLEFQEAKHMMAYHLAEEPDGLLYVLAKFYEPTDLVTACKKQRAIDIMDRYNTRHHNMADYLIQKHWAEYAFQKQGIQQGREALVWQLQI